MINDLNNLNLHFTECTIPFLVWDISSNSKIQMLVYLAPKCVTRVCVSKCRPYRKTELSHMFMTFQRLKSPIRHNDRVNICIALQSKTNRFRWSDYTDNDKRCSVGWFCFGPYTAFVTEHLLFAELFMCCNKLASHFLN